MEGIGIMKYLKCICAVFTALSITAFTGVFVSAETAAPQIHITKNLVIEGEYDVPDAEFNFEMTSLTDGAPKASIAPVRYSEGEEKGEAVDGKYTISKDSDIVFADPEKSGVFEYKLFEKDEDIEGVVYSDEVYIVHVQVIENDGKFVIKNIVAETEDGKTEEIVFLNKYTGTTDQPENGDNDNTDDPDEGGDPGNGTDTPEDGPDQDDVPITGILMQSAPFAIMCGAAVLIMAAIVVCGCRRRR